jgi:EmrB/QacA subfamily drug resistance transporter
MSARDTGTTPPDSRAGFSPGAILAFVCMGQFVVMTDVSIVNLALPSIQRGLNMSDVSLNYVITAYATVLGGFLLLCGRLADTLGRRRMLQSGFVLFALASLASGLASNGSVLITARGFQGLGSAMIAPAALSILTTTFEEGPARNKALGIWGSLSGIAGVLGVILGGILADGPGWEWIFWVNVPIGLGAAALAPRVVPESRAEAREGSFDFAGAVTLTGSLLLLIFTLGEATEVGWGTARTIGSLAGVAVLLAAVLVIESRAAAPVIPLRIFRLSTMRTANISALLVMGTMGAMFFFVSVFMQGSYGYSPLKAGFAYVPLAVLVAVGAGAAAGMITKVAAKPVLLTGLLLMTGGLLLIARAPSGGSYAVDLLPPFILLGLGSGIVYVTLQIAAFVGIGDEEAGVGAGLYNTSQEAGAALGLAVVSTIAYNNINTKLARTHGDPARILDIQETADHHAFFAAACLGVLGLLVVTFFMPRGKAASPAVAAAAAPAPTADTPAGIDG